MGRESRLVKNTMIIGIGMMCTKGISFLLLPMYTSLLSTEQFGITDMVNTIVTFVTFALTLQFEQGIFRFLVDCREDTKKQKKYISTTILSVSITLAIGILITFIICEILSFSYTIYLVVNIVVALYVAILNQIARGLGKITFYTISSFISAAGQIIFNVIFIAGLRWDVEGMLIATIIGQLLACLFVFFVCNIGKYIKIKLFDKVILKELLKYSLPLVPNTVCWWLVNLSDRLIITFVMGADTNGIYAVANKFPSLLTTVTNVFQISWTENAAECHGAKDRDEYYSKVMNQSVSLIISTCSIVIAVLPLAFRYLVNKNYGEAYYHILILLIAGLFHTWGNLYGSLFGALKCTKNIAKTTLYSAIINVIINIVLIKFIGLYAASFSTLAAYVIIAFMRHMQLKKHVVIVYKFMDLVVAFSLLIVASICYCFDNTYISLICTLISFVVFVISNKENIRKVMKKAFPKKGKI